MAVTKQIWKYLPAPSTDADAELVAFLEQANVKWVQEARGGKKPSKESLKVRAYAIARRRSDRRPTKSARARLNRLTRRAPSSLRRPKPAALGDEREEARGAGQRSGRE